jgi:class 3 adenylate cyclase
VHREFRELLKDAVGDPQLAIAVNVDIRGFSPFSESRDSFEIALYVKKVYIRLIDEYFTQASFFKPTGDGLLVVVHYTETNYKEVMTNTIKTCLAVLQDFPSSFVGDDMVRFEVPNKIGIGLSSGAACRLVSGDSDHKTLDYSGKVLNLASRLMDFARPSGVVFDSTIGIELLPTELAKLFVKDRVCARGIKSPVDIYHTIDTVIRASDRKPSDTIKWRTERVLRTAKEVRIAAREIRAYVRELRAVPADSKSIAVRASYPVPGRKHKARYVLPLEPPDFRYILHAGKPMVEIDIRPIAKHLDSNKAKDATKVTIEIRYCE